MPQNLLERVHKLGYLPIGAPREGLPLPAVFLRLDRGMRHLGSMSNLVVGKPTFDVLTRRTFDFDQATASAVEVGMWSKLLGWLSASLSLEGAKVGGQAKRALATALSVSEACVQSCEIDDILDAIPALDERLFEAIGRHQLAVSHEYLTAREVSVEMLDGSKVSSEVAAQLDGAFDGSLELVSGGSGAVKLRFRARGAPIVLGLRAFPVERTPEGIKARLGEMIPRAQRVAVWGGRPDGEQGSDELIVVVSDTDGSAGDLPVTDRP